MASKDTVQVVEKNEGQKIQWKQEDTKLIFGDDDLAIRCDTRQRDWPVPIDISFDESGNLITGVGLYYVAQIEIPPIEYEEVEVEETPAEEETESTETKKSVTRKPLPLKMGDVVLTLWSIEH